MENKFNLIYKVPDQFRYVSNGDGTAEELPDSEKRYFAKKTGNIFRDFVHANNCTQIKYGVYETEDKKVVTQFLEVGKGVKQTLEQMLWEKEQQAQKSKDTSKMNEIKLHKEYLAENWEEIEPTFFVQTIISGLKINLEVKK